MRRSYVQNPDPPYNLIPAEEYVPKHRAEKASFTVLPDIEPFVSPVDGKVITGRRALREHNRRHNVTNAADFKETWKKAAEERKNFHNSKAQREGRIEAIKAALEGKRV